MTEPLKNAVENIVDQKLAAMNLSTLPKRKKSPRTSEKRGVTGKKFKDMSAEKKKELDLVPNAAKESNIIPVNTRLSPSTMERFSTEADKRGKEMGKASNLSDTLRWIVEEHYNGGAQKSKIENSVQMYEYFEKLHLAFYRVMTAHGDEFQGFLDEAKLLDELGELQQKVPKEMLEKIVQEA